MNTPKVTILGIGNVLWADEGFGVRAVEQLHRQVAFDDEVKLIDGGTQGIYLVQHVRDADVLVVFDAIDYGLPPGTLKRIEGDDVPSFMGAKKMSLHQTGFQEVLAMAELMGDYPQHILLIGVQPEELEDYGGSLRPSVRAQIDPAIDAALAWLASKSIGHQRRELVLTGDAGLHPEQLAIQPYESQRPDSHNACRLGDERVLRDDNFTFDPKPQQFDSGGIRVDIDHRRND